MIKNFPLASHQFSRKAARASLAAYKQGKFWEFHRQLLENYDSMSDNKIEQIAKNLKLDMKKFKTDMNRPEIQRIIDRDIKNGREIGVTGTPTIYLNGKLTRIRNPSQFIKKIESELKKKE